MFFASRFEIVSDISAEEFHPLEEQHYTANGMLAAAHGGVIPNDRVLLLRQSVQGAPPCAPVRFCEPHPCNR